MSSHRDCSSRLPNNVSKLCVISVICVLHTLILVTSSQSLQIADQQTFTGKLYYYKFAISRSDIKHITVGKAGDDKSLPDWLYFKRDTEELIGIPFEKGLHFIQVQIENYRNQRWNDIFALEVVDGPQVSDHKCVLRVKQPFKSIADVWRTINYLTPSTIPHPKSQNFNEWLQKFSLSHNTNKEFLISYETEKCDANNLYTNQESDDDIRSKLSRIGLDSDLVQISRKLMDDNEVISNDKTYTDFQFNKHYRRHALFSTPVLGVNWMTLTTTTLLSSSEESHSSENDPLSRVLIPSMTSPTLTATASHLSAFEKSFTTDEHKHFAKFSTPFIYTTPALVSERPTIIEGHEDMFTPTIATLTPTLRTRVDTDSAVFITPSPSIPSVVTTPHVEVTTEGERIEKPITPPIRHNRPPVVNKLIKKMDLTAGKYWEFTIPKDIFSDEDGGTEQLKLTFLVPIGSGEVLPPTEYWIQFNHENQKLYAYPTEDDIGKHIFNLVAVDSGGLHVTETVEIHVRQAKSSRAFTHIFTLLNIKWNTFQFNCLIDAVKSLMERVAFIYGDPSINSISIQKIVRNDKDSSWTISWTNDSVPTTYCARDIIEGMYSKLHSAKLNDESMAEPSAYLIKAIAPEFTVQRVQLNYISMSACGDYEIPEVDGKTKQKESPVFRNRVGALGPYRVGQAFSYIIPEDTVYSPSRKVGTRDLQLSVLPIEPQIIPEFIFFDSDDQELFGLPLNPSDAKVYELSLTAEDSVNGVRANDAFTLEVKDDKEYDLGKSMFEITLNLIDLSRNEEMPIKDKVQVIQKIASDVLDDGDASAVHVLSIKKYESEAPLPQLTLDEENEIDDNELNINRKRRNSRYQRFDMRAPKHRHTRNSNKYYYEFKWTNRTIVGHHLCPKQIITSNIINRIFRRDDGDSLAQLKDVFTPDQELLSISFKPIGVCEEVLQEIELGVRPKPITSPTTPTIIVTSRPTLKEDEKIENAIDIDESNEFLLTTIIPPVAILIALIFAAIVGCCFHRANRRRKSVEISSRLPADNGVNEREAFLQKGRTPIILEFEQQNQQQQQNISSQQPYNFTPVILPPSQQQQHQHQQQQQMTPLRQLSSGKPTYQPLPQHGSQIRQKQPPPYYK